MKNIQINIDNIRATHLTSITRANKPNTFFVAKFLEMV